MLELKVNPIGDKYTTKLESDIYHFSMVDVGLRILIDTAPHDVNVRHKLEYVFPYHRGFRFLDEGDIFGYWDCEPFQAGHHLYEVVSGGWLDHELTFNGMLAISGSEVRHKEYFICTSNGCLSVLSQEPPLIREFK
ncbi:hypothetical protein ACNKU7_07090 [Microbulbifer sp. SA54]|uniref:hypothetical protein n=1 Tax=Microbulbifer sp. SA54 TaxID=3401577 RepID=UPI003AADA279